MFLSPQRASDNVMEMIVMAGIVAAVLVAQYLIYKNLGLKNVTYKLTISRNEAFENDEIEVIEEIENNKWLPLPWMRSEISCSRWLSFYGGSQSVGKDAQKGLVSGSVTTDVSGCQRAWMT